MKKLFPYLLLLGCLFLACGSTGDPSPGEPEYIEPTCVMAKVIEINPFLGCQASEIPGNDKDEFQKLILLDHPLYDTIYTRMHINHFVEGPAQFPIHVDSAANLNLLCNALYSIDYPELWVTKLEGTECQ